MIFVQVVNCNYLFSCLMKDLVMTLKLSADAYNNFESKALITMM